MSSDPAVLIVDDEEELVETYREVLEGSHRVLSATSGEEALETLDESVDVVLLDRRMPGLTGDEVLEEIRDRGHDCYVVMVTAVDPEPDTIAMEFDEYLVKPVTHDQLRDVVKQMLARKEFTEQIQEMFSLSSRLATLESKLDYEQLQRSEEYEALRAEFDTLRDEVPFPDDVDEFYLDSTMEKLEALLQGRR